MSCCGQTPIEFRASSSSVVMSNPLMYAVPDDGGSIPISMLIAVVFPINKKSSKKKIILKRKIVSWIRARNQNFSD
jgi:hypothetical protein